LDGRVLKSPARGKFELPGKDLACIVAAEWDAQTNQHVGIQIIPSRDFIQQTCISYLATDTALFYTSPDDRVLLRKQQKHFQPLLKWINEHYKIELNEASSDAFTGKIHHPESSIEIIKDEMSKMVRYIYIYIDVSVMYLILVILLLVFHIYYFMI